MRWLCMVPYAVACWASAWDDKDMVTDAVTVTGSNGVVVVGIECAPDGYVVTETFDGEAGWRSDAYRSIADARVRQGELVAHWSGAA